MEPSWPTWLVAGGGDADGLGVDHFAHDAARCGGTMRMGLIGGVLGGDFLEAAEGKLEEVSLPGRATPSPADDARRRGRNQPVRVRPAEDGSMPE